MLPGGCTSPSASMEYTRLSRNKRCLLKLQPANGIVSLIHIPFAKASYMTKSKINGTRKDALLPVRDSTELPGKGCEYSQYIRGDHKALRNNDPTHHTASFRPLILNYIQSLKASQVTQSPSAKALEMPLTYQFVIPYIQSVIKFPVFFSLISIPSFIFIIIA